MVIFLSIIAGMSFIGTISEGDRNKQFAQNLAGICCSSIIATSIIYVFSN